MDDKAALIARRVAMSAAAWFNAPRMSRPIAGSPWRSASGTPTAPGRLRLTADDSELLDELADVAPP
jgi:hypothetical protein